MELFRSEEMQLMQARRPRPVPPCLAATQTFCSSCFIADLAVLTLQLMMPSESAHDTVAALGEVGLLQFKDLN